jgi:phage gp46-like protein
MGIDRGIDPYTGEYLQTKINHLGNAVYIRLATPLGSWWADPSIGSRLHELARSKDLPRIGVLARQYAAAALQPLLDDGRARSIDVTSEQPHDGRCLLRITVVDALGRQATFQHPVRVA